jgi:hypothetical protein
MPGSALPSFDCLVSCREMLFLPYTHLAPTATRLPAVQPLRWQPLEPEG